MAQSAPLSGTANWVGLEIGGGRYLVTSKLAEGGMAHVYLAQDRQANTTVVLKVPRLAMLEDADFVQRFAREVRSLAAFSHPHIVRILNVGEHQGIPFAIMEHLTGGSVRDLRRKEGGSSQAPLRLEDLNTWLPGVADALDFIHRRGLIHRDVKPDNILFDGTGRAFLSDFGIAKAWTGKTQAAKPTALTGTGVVPGTPYYIAPELVRNEPYDGRVDQYALAITVYELVSGQRPFDGLFPAAILMLHTTQEATPLHEVLPAFPRGASAAIVRGMAKDPTKRFPNCMAFVQAILQGSSSRIETKPNTAVASSNATTTNFDNAPKPSAAPPSGNSAAPTYFMCPKCHTRLRVQATDAQNRVRCPQCATVLQLPSTAVAAGTAIQPVGVSLLTKDETAYGKTMLAVLDEGQRRSSRVKLWTFAGTILLVGAVFGGIYAGLSYLTSKRAGTQVADASRTSTGKPAESLATHREQRSETKSRSIIPPGKEAPIARDAQGDSANASSSDKPAPMPREELKRPSAKLPSLFDNERVEPAAPAKKAPEPPPKPTETLPTTPSPPTDIPRDTGSPADSKQPDQETQRGRTVADLEKLLRSRGAADRIKAAEALARLGPDARSALGTLGETLVDQDARVQKSALDALERIDPKAYQFVLTALIDRDPEARTRAIRELSKLGREGTVGLPMLVRTYEAELGTRGRTRTVPEIAAILRATCAIAPREQRVIRLVLETIKTNPFPQDHVRDDQSRRLSSLSDIAVDLLNDIEITSPIKVKYLLLVLADRPSVTIIGRLAALGPDAREAVPVLTELKRHSEGPIREAATSALERIQ